MKILLTGGAGYIGSHTALSLLDAVHDVTIIDNLSTGNKKVIPQKANFIECNIEDNVKIDLLLKKERFDALLHFAGYIKVEESVKNPKKYFDNNTENAKILFDTCVANNLNNIIFSSTAATYGESKSMNPVKENDELKPLNPYGESKLKTENYIINNSEINYIIFRYFNVAGADPLLRSGLISDESTHLIKIVSEVAVGKRNKVIIFGEDYPTNDGTPIRDYIHVSDLANIHLKGLEYLFRKKKSNIINCGYGKGFSVKEVIQKFNEVSNNKIAIEKGARRPGDSAMLVSDITKLNTILNWKPKYNDLSYIIKTSIDWEKKLSLK